MFVFLTCREAKTLLEEGIKEYAKMAHPDRYVRRFWEMEEGSSRRVLVSWWCDVHA